MNSKIKIALSTISLVPVSLLAQPHQQPNVVMILADDIGYGDLEWLKNSPTIHTPNVNDWPKRVYVSPTRTQHRLRVLHRVTAY